MSEYHDAMLGERFAGIYDSLFSWYVPSEAQLRLLAEKARGGTVLEVGAGTGRLAIPLAQRGVPVVALDISPEMLAELAKKASGLPIDILAADATSFTVDTACPLVLAAFNLITLLDGQPAQRAFLQRARAALEPDGELIVEAFVPHPDVIPGTEELKVRSQSAHQVILEVGRHIPAAQRCEFQYVVLRHGEPVQLLPHRMCYLWPQQLDDLAADCGLRLVERFSDWRGSPFDAQSRSNISVYRRA